MISVNGRQTFLFSKMQRLLIDGVGLLSLVAFVVCCLLHFTTATWILAIPLVISGEFQFIDIYLYFRYQKMRDDEISKNELRMTQSFAKHDSAKLLH